MTPNGLLSMTKLALICLTLTTCVSNASEQLMHQADASPESLWVRDNLFPWVVDMGLAPRDRAAFIRKYGFKSYAYISEPQQRNIEEMEANIRTLKENGINPIAWWFPFSAHDPVAKETLDLFRRYSIRPQLWVSPAYRDLWEDLRRAVPEETTFPTSQREWKKLSEAEREKFGEYAIGPVNKHLKSGFYAKTRAEHRSRINEEADRLHALVKLAAAYGSKVALYNHGGWSGMMANQLAIISRLRELGISDVKIVYAFNHVRDAGHDETINFQEVWTKIRPHVTAVILAPVCFDFSRVPYLSQGDSELEMMRIIERSGWKGPIGLHAMMKKGEDEGVTMSKTLQGLEWMSAELQHAGSGGSGPKPILACE